MIRIDDMVNQIFQGLEAQIIDTRISIDSPFAIHQVHTVFMSVSTLERENTMINQPPPLPQNKQQQQQ